MFFLLLFLLLPVVPKCWWCGGGEGRNIYLKPRARWLQDKMKRVGGKKNQSSSSIHYVSSFFWQGRNVFFFSFDLCDHARSAGRRNGELPTRINTSIPERWKAKVKTLRLHKMGESKLICFRFVSVFRFSHPSESNHLLMCALTLILYIICQNTHATLHLRTT